MILLHRLWNSLQKMYDDVELWVICVVLWWYLSNLNVRLIVLWNILSIIGRKKCCQYILNWLTKVLVVFNFNHIRVCNIITVCVLNYTQCLGEVYIFLLICVGCKIFKFALFVFVKIKKIIVKLVCDVGHDKKVVSVNLRIHLYPH